MPNDRLKNTRIIDRLATLCRRVQATEESGADHGAATTSLHEMEKIFDAFMEHSPIYVFFKDATTKAIRLSRNYEQMLGRPLDDLWDRTGEVIFPGDLAKNMTADDLMIMKDMRPCQIEEELNGRAYKTIKFPIVIDGKKKYLAGFTIDITEQKKMEAECRAQVDRLHKTLGVAVQSMAATVEARDPYTTGHHHRVSDIARSIATKMQLTRDQIEGLRLASAIHDIGKISIPEEILSKPSQLTNLEYALIRTHPQTGYNILKDIEFPWPVAQMVLEHHERIDGSGYPDGLSGASLTVESRIMAVADVVDAMASQRPHRPSLGIGKALDWITEQRNILFDPDAVDACLWLYNAKGYRWFNKSR